MFEVTESLLMSVALSAAPEQGIAFRSPEAVIASEGNDHKHDNTNHEVNARWRRLVRVAEENRRAGTADIRSARRLVSAARHAIEAGDEEAARAYFTDARAVRGRAHKFYSFARLCERRAHRLAVLAGFVPDTAV